MSMTSSNLKSEVLIGPERRRRRTPVEKLAIIAETHEPEVRNEIDELSYWLAKLRGASQS